MKRIFTLTLLVVLLILVFSNTALAAGGDESPAQPQPFTVFTRYPVQEAALGENIAFDLTLQGGTVPQITQLDVDNLPDGWTATFRGGSDVVRAVYVQPDNETSVKLRVDPPAGVKAGTYNFVVVATGEKETAQLPIELIIQEKLPPKLTFDVDLPTLRGAPDSTFRYDVKLKNEGNDDLSVNLVANTPPGFLLTFKLSGKEVTSMPLAANEIKSLSVEVNPYAEMPAQTYPIDIVAQGSDTQAEATLNAEIIGRAKLSISAPDGRLSGKAYVGDVTPLTLVVQNTGTAPARNIQLTASPPAGWLVEFDPKTIAELAAGKQMEITANLQPADQAIAGDYMVPLHARAEDGPNQSADFRITVLTSTMWGIVGVALIAVAVLVIGLAVMRFGRR
jgi:uncharacterized repeat protein (TIGR01451 family)